MKVLIVDDAEPKCLTLQDDLREANYDVISVDSLLKGLQLLQNEVFDVMVTDLRMPGMSGIEFLKLVKQRYPHTTVIVMVAYANIETTIEAMKFGAYDYIKKPFLSEELILMLDKLKALRAEVEVGSLRKREPDWDLFGVGQLSFYRFIGKNSQIQEIMDRLPPVAESDSNVMLYGEQGSGMVPLARAIHLQSSRKHGPFISLNCQLSSAEQLAQNLFGDSTLHGRFKLAAGGTLCLKNIDVLPFVIQTEMMHWLSEQGETAGATDKPLRLIGTAEKDLTEKMKDGTFLPELYYYINVISLFLPALRERKSDIPTLINHFLEFSSPHHTIRVQPKAMEYLVAYPWPGNLPEMKNVVEKFAAVSGDREITVEDIPLKMKLPLAYQLDETISVVDFHEVMESTERELIVWAMQKARGDKTQAARLLSMKPATFRDVLAKHQADITGEQD